MLFHPDFIEPQPGSAAAVENNLPPKTIAKNKPISGPLQLKMALPAGGTAGSGVNSNMENSYKMFSAVSPSPTRSMIKEANDHLQLLHKRVTELERTVQDQAEALIRKDELMQSKLRELAEAKDSHISELKRCIENYEQRIRGLERLQHEKDVQLEQLSRKFGSVEDLECYVPALEKLLVSLKNFPTRHSTDGAAGSTNNDTIGGGSRHGSATGRSLSGVSGRAATRKLKASGGGSPPSVDRQRGHPLLLVNSGGHHHHLATLGAVGGTASSPGSMVNSVTGVGQAVADLRIGRSFNINSNFSMSDDEDDDDADKYS